MSRDLASVENRVAYACAMTKGTMPIALVVIDEGQKAAALKLLKGRRNARLITVKTGAESAAPRAEPEG